MPISLIVGPPNAGRVREVVARLTDALDRDPVLVVPGADDASRFERELCEEGGASVGATVTTFEWLVESLVPVLGLELPPRLSAPQRLALVRTAMHETELRILVRSSSRPGFAPALDTLIAELQGALVTPDALEAAAADLERGDYEGELAELYRAYVRIRDRAARSDAGSAMDAVLRGLRTDPGAWRARPVLIYGFDDLTRAQMELVEALADACDVTISVNYADRRALEARATLPSEFAELGAETVARLEHDPGYTESALLAHLDRNLFEPEAERVEPDGGLELLESAGDLGEAETIGLEIARLLSSGEAVPDGVAVVLRHPNSAGPAMARTLERLGIPVALDARIPLARTAVGHSLLSLCRAARGSAEALVEHLRDLPGVGREPTDWVERRLARREARDVAEAVASWEHPPRHLARLQAAEDGAARMRALADSAREIAEEAHRRAAPLAGERGPEGSPLVATELRAGVVAAELLDELAAVAEIPGCHAPDLDEAMEAIEGAAVRAWQGPSEGRVRIVGPYRLRALPLTHLFVASLQEGEFPGSRPLDPLLGEERRSALGMSELRRRDQAQEERYLFHACVSRPTRRLYLCWRSCDDEGATLARSPFVDEVLDLLAPDPAVAEKNLKRSRGLENAVVEPGEAPTPRELARALAARGVRSDGVAGAVAVPAPVASEVEQLLSAVPPATLPGPLEVPAVLEELRGRQVVSASSLEGWLECSYRWFVGHELKPEGLEPTADPLWIGGTVHRALRRLYAEPPGDGEALPRPNDVRRWKERFGELLEEECGTDLQAGGPQRATALARVREQVEAFLDEEAACEATLRPRPDLLERGFGMEGEDDPGPLKLTDDLVLRGSIDRIDVAPDGRAAVVRDYKTSSAVTAGASFEKEGKLQAPLYMLAARELLDLEPIAGLYQPLGAYRDRRPRGIALRDPRLEGLSLVNTDLMDEERFDAELKRARTTAVAAAGAMRDGAIGRDPLGGTCPRWCKFQTICRLERAVGVEDEPNGGGGNGGGAKAGGKSGGKDPA